MTLGKFGIIVFCLIILGITMAYYLPTFDTMVDAWGSVNTSGNYTYYTGVAEASQFMPLVWLFLPFGIVVIALFLMLRKRGE